MAAEEGSGSEMWPLVCFHVDSPSLGDFWYTFDYEKLSLVGHLKSGMLGGWTMMGDDIYWASGRGDDSQYSKNLLKHNITYPRKSTWETVSQERQLGCLNPLVVPADKKLYVLAGFDCESQTGSDCESQYWGEVYDLDYKKWEQVLKLESRYECFDSGNAAAFVEETGGVPTTTIVYYSVHEGRMLFYNLNDGTMRYEYHPSLNWQSGLRPNWVPRYISNFSRPVVRDSTLYWFTDNLYLYGYDFICEKWFRSPCLQSEMSIMSPALYDRKHASSVLVDLCNGKFLVIHQQDGGELAIASFTVVKGEDSLNVSVETRHFFADLPDNFRADIPDNFSLHDGMAMTCRKVCVKAKNTYKNGIHPMFKVVSDIVLLQPDDDDIASYLSQIETLKDQFDSVMPYSNNLNDQEQQRYIFFMTLVLSRLSDDHLAVRHQILSSPSIPTIKEVLAGLRRISSEVSARDQRRFFAPKVTSDETSEMDVQSNNSQCGPTKGKERKHCTHCDQVGHTRDTCWSLHGRPPNKQ